MKKYLIAELIKQITVLTYKPSIKELVQAHLTLRSWSYQELLDALVEENIRVYELRTFVENWNEDRIDVIGQNGNDGLHYDRLQ